MLKERKKNQRLNLCSSALQNMCGFFIDYLFINSSFFLCSHLPPSLSPFTPLTLSPPFSPRCCAG